MRAALAHALSRFAHWLRPKNAPASLTGNQWTGTSFLDSFQRNRQPNANDLLTELKGTAWTCATLNASVCATYPPRLYVATHPNQPQPRCLTRALPAAVENRLRTSPSLPPRFTKAAQLEEVLDHPLLTLLQKVNPQHNAFDLWELTHPLPLSRPAQPLYRRLVAAPRLLRVGRLGQRLRRVSAGEVPEPRHPRCSDRA